MQVLCSGTNLSNEAFCENVRLKFGKIELFG